MLGDEGQTSRIQGFEVEAKRLMAMLFPLTLLFAVQPSRKVHASINGCRKKNLRGIITSSSSDVSGRLPFPVFLRPFL